MALERNTAAASECGSPANHIVIPLSSFAKTLNLYQSVCLHFLHNHCFALWSTTCQKCDSVMSSQSKPISRPLEFNTQTCASALQRGAIKWLGVQARTVMPWTRWRTSADTHRPPLQYKPLVIHSTGTVYTALLTTALCSLHSGLCIAYTQCSSV